MRPSILLLLSMLLFCGCRETILHDLDELQANRVRVILAQADIESSKVREGASWSVTVDSAVATKALVSLENSRVLKHDELVLSQQQNSLISSREERNHILERQLAAGLGHTLERLPHVLEARVHLYRQDHEQLSLTPRGKRQSASVLIITEKLDAIDVAQVKHLVAGASGLSAEAISVLVATSQAQKHTPPVIEVQDNVGELSQSIPLQRWLLRNRLSLIATVLLLAVILFALRMSYGQSDSQSSKKNKQAVNQFTPDIEVLRRA